MSVFLIVTFIPIISAHIIVLYYDSKPT